MGFIQFVEFTTSNIDEMRELGRKYQEETEGQRSASRGMMCADRDMPGRYVVVAEFPSYEEAMKNSEDPRTQALSEAMGKLADGPASYRNLDVLEVWEDSTAGG
jgi:quinol monooxygenase YgiN